MYGSSMLYEELLRADAERCELLCSEEALRLNEEIAKLQAEEAKMQLVLFVAGMRLNRLTLSQEEYDIVADEYEDARAALVAKQLQLSKLTSKLDHKITCLQTNLMMLSSALESAALTTGFIVDTDGCAIESIFPVDLIQLPFVCSRPVL